MFYCIQIIVVHKQGLTVLIAFHKGIQSKIDFSSSINSIYLDMLLKECCLYSPYFDYFQLGKSCITFYRILTCE